MVSRSVSFLRARTTPVQPPTVSSAPSQPQLRTASLSASMATVNMGRARLEPANTDATWGTTYVTRNSTMTTATRLTMAGYRDAPSSLPFSVSRASRSSARLSSTWPSAPLCSPAPMTAVYTAENSLGCCCNARAKLDPAFTSARKVASRLRWRSSSASSASAASARSSGKPELTRPASWRVQTASAAAL
jgi:hypothetical protein